MIEENPEFWGPEFAASLRAAKETPSVQPCGHLTTAKGACTKMPARSAKYGVYVPGVQGCWWHLTDDERRQMSRWEAEQDRSAFADLHALKSATVRPATP